MVPLILTLVALAIFLFGTVFVGLSAVKIKQFGSNSNISVLSKEYRDQLIAAYNKAFSKFNMDAMKDMLTEYMHYTTSNTLKVLRKIGVRKEVTFTPDAQYDAATAGNPFSIVHGDGKNDFTLSTMKGDYCETYYDADSNRKIYERTRKTDYTIDFLKSNNELADTPHNCINCGAELTLNGNMLDCPSCGTHYQVENYKWNISNIQVGSDSANPWVMPVLFAGLGVLIASAISMLVKSAVFTAILIVIDLIGIFLAVTYVNYVKKGIDVIKEMEKYDENASRLVFFKRVNYLVRCLDSAKDFNIREAKPVLTRELYAELKENNKTDDNYVLDLDISKIYPSNFRIEGNRQCVDVELTIDRLVMNPKKKIKNKTSKEKYTLSKHVNAKTNSYTQAQAVICPNCNASINLITDTKCKYCDTEVDASLSDWVISKM